MYKAFVVVKVILVSDLATTPLWAS